MASGPIQTPDPEHAAIIAAQWAKIRTQCPTGIHRWLLVSVDHQRLTLLQKTEPLQSWPVSTARVGLDNRVDSYGTPPGAHAIASKIGQGARPGTVFVSREPTGEIWQPAAERLAPEDRDLILTRILVLVGLEDGINRGPGIDSFLRHIYLHGTNHEQSIGTPVSAGCVRLRNSDMITLFDPFRSGRGRRPRCHRLSERTWPGSAVTPEIPGCISPAWAAAV
jgi:UDP-N-acetylmuramate--alanine ligase